MKGKASDPVDVDNGTTYSVTRVRDSKEVRDHKQRNSADSPASSSSSRKGVGVPKVAWSCKCGRVYRSGYDGKHAQKHRQTCIAANSSQETEIEGSSDSDNKLIFRATRRKKQKICDSTASADDDYVDNDDDWVDNADDYVDSNNVDNDADGVDLASVSNLYDYDSEGNVILPITMR